jgi:putative endonuclease
MKQPAVYILASRRNGTLYTGVTSDLLRRIWEHRNDLVEGFTKRYGVHSLAYFELHDDMPEAICREKQIKKWNRAWKIKLIEKTNPLWRDLWPSLIGEKSLDSCLNGKAPGFVVPAEAGFQELPAKLDSRLRGNDRRGKK